MSLAQQAVNASLSTSGVYHTMEGPPGRGIGISPSMMVWSENIDKVAEEQDAFG